MLPAGYLSMSPTTKNIEPRIATMSATSWPGSSSLSAWMLLNDAERSFSRYGRLLALGDQVVAVDAERVLGPGVGVALGRLQRPWAAAG